MDLRILIVGFVLTALLWEYFILRYGFGKHRLIELVMIASVANAGLWAFSLTGIAWMRWSRFAGEFQLPMYPWYGFAFGLLFYAAVFSIAGSIPAGILATVYRKVKKRSKATKATKATTTSEAAKISCKRNPNYAKRNASFHPEESGPTV